VFLLWLYAQCHDVAVRARICAQSGGKCALYFACVEGQRAAVELLLAHGAVKHSNHVSFVTVCFTFS
jgi:hypothetical protein